MLRSCFLLILLSAWTAAGASEPEEMGLVSARLWIAANTPYRDIEVYPTPSLQRMPAAALEARLGASGGHAGLGKVTTAAAYLPSENLILMDASITDSVIATGYLIHELLHAYQIADGKPARVDCINALEQEAYHYQIKYLDQMGAATDYIMSLRLSSLVFGRCPPKY